MQKKRQLSSFLIGLALLGAAQGAWALGWARAQQSAVLGQPLDFAATLRLDPGDSIAPECVSAEVVVGDHRLPAPSVRLQVDTSNADALMMRVLSNSSIDEPVVTVTLFIGCPARMSRRFVLLLDPPALTPPAVMAVAPVAAEPARVAAAIPASDAPAAPAPAVVRSAPPPGAQSKPAPAAPKKPRPPKTNGTPSTSPAAPALARLKLDAVEPAPKPAAASAAASAVAEALDAVAQAASAARAAASAASQAEARVAALEKTVNQLRAESNANRDLVTQMRARLTDAESTSRWLLPLLLALVALAGLAGWLSWRLRQVQSDRQAAWRRAAAEADAAREPMPTSQLPLVTSEIMAPAKLPQAAVVTPLPSAAPLPPETAMERTQVLPPQALSPVVDDGSPRDVSIEELLDLEQQAEFFIVLGQEDAAVDLLVDHLRNTGGGSPLPYLKLLEIYRRRGARDAYERTRTRFNHRFNAYAPEWDADLQQGRTLEDYPGVLPRLQQVWPRPLDAMAELEALLFRKSRGDLFELPAYREVLFLYSLARDLLDREAADSGNVDLLLPLADGGEFSSTAPHPYFGVERDSVFDSLGGSATADRATAPVDLDLTQPEAPSVIEPPPPPRRG